MLERLRTDEEMMKVLQEAKEKVDKQHPLDVDKWLYRIAVIILGLLTLIAAVGSLTLRYMLKMALPLKYWLLLVQQPLARLLACLHQDPLTGQAIKTLKALGHRDGRLAGILVGPGSAAG